MRCDTCPSLCNKLVYSTRFTSYAMEQTANDSRHLLLVQAVCCRLLEGSKRWERQDGILYGSSSISPGLVWPVQRHRLR